MNPLRFAATVVALTGWMCSASHAQAPDGLGKAEVPDWAIPGSATHKQVPPPPDFHRPTIHLPDKVNGFSVSDIGAPLVPGNHAFARGVYTVGSAGYNIWYTRDEFRFLWKPMKGDVSLAASIAFPDPNGYGDRKGVLAVYSLSKAKPLKQGHFDARFSGFENREHFSDWKFAATGQALMQGQVQGQPLLAGQTHGQTPGTPSLFGPTSPGTPPDQPPLFPGRGATQSGMGPAAPPPPPVPAPAPQFEPPPAAEPPAADPPSVDSTEGDSDPVPPPPADNP